MEEPSMEEEDKERTTCVEKNLEDEKIVSSGGMTRKEKRKAIKRLKRKQIRKDIAAREREEEEARLNDPEEQRRLLLMEKEEAERVERETKLFEERERAWIEAIEKKMKEAAEEEQRKLLEETHKQQQDENVFNDDDEWEYVEEGPAEIIWQGNEIILKKKKVRIPKKDLGHQIQEDPNRPTSNPLPPDSYAFADHTNSSIASAQEVLESVAQQVPNFGTEQDKAHCPFHLKTGACRFGQRCSRVHFYPDKACTLLMKNMYNGPGLAWEQDEGLEYTDEEVERSFEEFYEDVHTEFLKFGEIVNFKNVAGDSQTLTTAISDHGSRWFTGKGRQFLFFWLVLLSYSCSVRRFLCFILTAEHLRAWWVAGNNISVLLSGFSFSKGLNRVLSRHFSALYHILVVAGGLNNSCLLLPYFAIGQKNDSGGRLPLCRLNKKSKVVMGTQRLAIEAKTFDLSLEQSGSFFRLSGKTARALVMGKGARITTEVKQGRLLCWVPRIQSQDGRLLCWVPRIQSQVQQGSITQKTGVQTNPVQRDVGVQTEEAEMVTLGDVRVVEPAGKGEMGTKVGEKGEPKKAEEGEFFDEASIISFLDNEEGLLIEQLEKEYEEQERDQKMRHDDAFEGVASLLGMDVSEGNINDNSRGILTMPEEGNMTHGSIHTEGVKTFG
ncbi:zinc finger CCCH domain-containing protein 5-like isoform X1 [Senna tora]|uniref:Zinc finger CCCH domain-containing protein 5-like isoform X1 n=1 Tax=Senna tora TaxID=362788 RepID=A0A834SRP3_9FABA|nr:zinc finger CCCH domain-containing protein 5-like isoform X1 [Senna tora]